MDRDSAPSFDSAVFHEAKRDSVYMEYRMLLVYGIRSIVVPIISGWKYARKIHIGVFV